MNTASDYYFDLTPKVVKHIWIGGLLCLVSLLACTRLFSLNSDRIPPGTYRMSCSDIKMHDGSLRARCQKVNGNFVETELYEPSRCRKDIANLDGHLLCNDSKAPSPAPQETLSVSARDRERTIGQYQHTAWTAKDGAPGRVEALAQTTDGFLWLGTPDGLYRFDGVTFERYEPPSWAAFPAAQVYSLLALPNGDLWIGFSRAISVLRDGNVRNYTAADGVPAGRVLGLAQDREGTIWVATLAGLARLEGNRWKEAGREWDFPGRLATAVFADGKGTLWVATEDTIVFLQAGTRQFQQTGARVGEVAQFDEAPNGKLWMAETTRSVRPVPLGERRQPSDDREIAVGSQGILFDRDGALWITTIGDGMRRAPAPETLKGKVGEFSTSVESFTKKDGLSDDVSYGASPILQDHEGDIWVGTRKGLDRFRKTNVVPITLPLPPEVTPLAAGGGGDLWLASVITGQVIRVHDGRTYFEPVINAHSGWYVDPKGILWCFHPPAVYRLEKERLSILPLPKDFSGPIVSDMHATEDHIGELWLAGAHNGLFRLENGKWTKFDAGPEVEKSNASAALTDWMGRVWFGYETGTIVILNGITIEKVFSPQESQVEGIETIAGSSAHVWVGGDSGLALFEGGRFHPVAPADAAHFRAILGIVETSQGDLWLCETRGLIHITSAEVRKVLESPGYRVKYDLFDSLDGLPATFRSARSHEFQSPDGRIWFGTANGVAWINPSNLLKNTLPPPVAIRSVSADQKQYSSLTNLILPPLTRSIRIGYTGLSFSVPEHVRFRYKLAGVDMDWQDAGTRREAFYNNLGPASYRFRVIACNNDGVWNEQGAALDFSIAPAWYQTVWFRALCGAGFLALLWGIYQFRVQQLQQKFAIGLEARVNERTRIARDLHDTLLQSVQGLILRFQLVEDLLPEGKAKDQLEQTLQRADQAIAEGRRAVYDLRCSTAAPTDLAQAVRSQGDEFATENSAAFHLVVEGAARDLNPIICDELYLITREALRNAFSHARAHHIETDITYGERAFRLRIRDDGRGIPAQILEEGRPGHYGLSGMRERAKQVGGKLDFWSRAGAGTELEISIPGSIAYRTSSARSLFPLFGRKQGDL